MATGSLSSVHVRGLKPLIKAFKDMPEDVAEEFVWELEEAADPVRKRSEDLMHEMVNVRPPYDHFRVGVSKAQSTVWVAPSWRRGGGSPRPEMAPHIRKRMERAVDERRDAVINKIEDMLDRIADHHGF
jgi:hypothetical protein